MADEKEDKKAKRQAVKEAKRARKKEKKEENGERGRRNLRRQSPDRRCGCLYRIIVAFDLGIAGKDGCRRFWLDRLISGSKGCTCDQ